MLKVGDRIRAVNPHAVSCYITDITLGREYQILGILYSHSTYGDIVNIRDDNGNSTWYYLEGFSIVGKVKRNLPAWF